MGIFSRKKTQKSQKRTRRVKSEGEPRAEFLRRSRRLMPGMARRAGDYFRAHPTAEMKAAA